MRVANVFFELSVTILLFDEPCDGIRLRETETAPSFVLFCAFSCEVDCCLSSVLTVRFNGIVERRLHALLRSLVFATGDFLLKPSLNRLFYLCTNVFMIRVGVIEGVWPVGFALLRFVFTKLGFQFRSTLPFGLCPLPFSLESIDGNPLRLWCEATVFLSWLITFD